VDNFTSFASTLNKRINSMSKNELYIVGDTLDRDSIWLTYLDAFPDGTNEIYRERRTYDCSTCRQFVKNWGNVVEIDNGQVFSIWDARTRDALPEGPYREVAYAMDEYVKSLPLSGIFRTSERQYGNEVTRAMVDGNLEVWNHFHGEVAAKHFTTDVGTVRGNFNTSVQVFQRGLEELSSSALATVVDLIEDNALYRGEEHLRAITEFQSLQNKYKRVVDKLPFVYENATSPAARFRNTVIGTLVDDLSKGMDLDAAVRSFEAKVAPANYKRPKSLITPAMVKAAMKTIDELGIEESLQRRFANIADVSIDNVLWVDNDARDRMKEGSIGSLLMSTAQANVKPLAKNAKPEPMSITAFMKDVLPSATGVELLVRNTHEGNFVSLTTAVHGDAPNLFKWDNPFAWSYNGNVTDSIKEKVKKAGGNVTAKLRVSLSWFNYDDLDIHVYEPNGNHIYYGAKQGKLDIDMNAGGKRSREAVENITWSRNIQNGDYRVVVNNFSVREPGTDVGFVIETESDGRIEHYSYKKAVRNDVEVGIMRVEDGQIVEFKTAKDIEGGSASKEIWGVATEQFQKVETVMFSPNFWDDQAHGNKHYIFTLANCRNDTPVRGIYNEYLRGDLTEHRKVFEIVGEKTKAQPTDEQVSGLGFSSTAGSSIVARVVSGNRQRLLDLQF
jgi:hypothetical protein